MRVQRTQYAVLGWGEGELWTNDEVVLAHDFRFTLQATASPGAASAAAPEGVQEPPTGTLAGAGSHVGDVSVASSARTVDAQELVRRFEAFFTGEPVVFADVPLDVEHFTGFQRSVASILRGIPRGEVVTYGELAALAGHPGAQRAVGTFCARNRFMFLLPCHRVVGAGGIGPYGASGVAVKRRLLALEGVRL